MEVVESCCRDFDCRSCHVVNWFIYSQKTQSITTEKETSVKLCIRSKVEVRGKKRKGKRREGKERKGKEQGLG